MDYENIEPWNMFTNDFVAEETDEILTDDILAGLKNAGNGDGCVDGNFSSSGCAGEVKQEPEDVPEESQNECVNADDNYIAPGYSSNHLNMPPIASAQLIASNYKSRTRHNDDDDTIFNFGLDNSHSNSDEHIAINYESAVVYICPACGAEFNAQDAWKRHMNGTHDFNTRRGLNFIQLDKLYHECLECHKRIAMHAMENLLKHKFTHLPYRCTKCKMCMRQYKYRQDLMVHLRTTHRDDLLALARAERNPGSARPASSTANNNARMSLSNNGNRSTPLQRPSSSGRLEIRDIKENAIDIFENTYEGIEVKNELLEPDDSDIADQSSNSFALASFLDDGISRSSSHNSERRAAPGTTSSGNGGGDTVTSANNDELFEKYIQYICPQCATEYGTQSQWRQHIESVHDFGTRKGLNFQEINMFQNAQCLECNKVLQINAIRVLQLHKFTHLPHKSWLRCKLCFRSCVGLKEIRKHLEKQHRLGGDCEVEGDSQDARTLLDMNDDDTGEDQLLTEPSSSGISSKNEERDSFEPHIDYLCPQCGKEFFDKKLWRKHIVKVHHLTDLQTLHFKLVNERQVMCLDCDKVITNAYGIQNAQQHRFTHMPYKAFIRCRMCAKSYTDRKGLVKHLNTVHRIPRDSQFSHTGMSSPQPAVALPKLQQTLAARATISKYKQQPQKEIVRHADVTYEIQYLDDDDDSNSLLGNAPPVPELSFSNSFERLATLKCSDCGSIFPSKYALRLHISEEHEFLDFNNLKPLPEKRDSQRASNLYARPATSATGGSINKTGAEQSLDELSSDANDLLVPTGDEDVSFTDTQATAADSIERNFCYLCPACGVEFKTQIVWRRHINEAHNYDKRHYLNFRPIDRFRFQCRECKDIISCSKLKALQDHKFRHLPYKLYIKCLLCSTCYNHKPNMISHLRMRHNIIDTRYPSQSSRERDYDYGSQMSSSPRPASSLTSASSSISNKPPGLKTVEDCISFHNAVDHETITYFCPQCNENFDSHVFWRKHIVDEHNLNSREGLNFRQIDVHHYLCLQCYKRVTVTHTKGAIGQLQSHKFRHLPYKSFKCVRCNNEFVRKQMFFKHLNRATNLCNSRFLNNGADEADVTIAQPQKKTTTAIAVAAGIPDADDMGQNDSLILNQNTFMLICPQCRQEFESWRPWREHINIVHDLGKRETLKFRKISPTLHQCLVCNKHVNGKKLRDLQIHKFKHLPYSAYIQCRFCPTSFQHIGNMKVHLQQRHPNVVQKHDEYARMDELQRFEECSLENEDEGNDTDLFADEQEEQVMEQAADQENEDDNDVLDAEETSNLTDKQVGSAGNGAAQDEAAEDEENEENDEEDEEEEEDDDDEEQEEESNDLDPDEQFLLG